MDDWEARQLAYDLTVATGAFLEGLGMLSENLQRMHLGQSMAYGEKEFTALIDRTGMFARGAEGRSAGDDR